MDVAIVKATNHVECPPKERHLRSEFLLFFFSFRKFSDLFLVVGFLILVCVCVGFLPLYLGVLFQKFWLPHQRFGLEPMLLIAFMPLRGDWPRPIIGRYGIFVFWDSICTFPSIFEDLGLLLEWIVV